MQTPCGFCGNASVGEYVKGRDCRYCWLGMNRSSHAAWHPDPVIRATAPPVKSCGDKKAKKRKAAQPAYTVSTSIPEVRRPIVSEVREPIPTAGPSGKPGTELTRLIRLLGFPLCQVKCKEMANWMDELGPWGSWAQKDTILEQLRATAEKLKWHQRLKAAGLALANGLAFKLDPMEPAPGLLAEAVRRALRNGDEPILLTLAPGDDHG